MTLILYSIFLGMGAGTGEAAGGVSLGVFRSPIFRSRIIQ